MNHIIINTKPEDSISPLGDTSRRLSVILLQIEQFVNKQRDRDFVIYVESAMLNGAMAHHLYEMGMYYMALYNMFSEHRLRFITPAALKKQISGKGNASKNHDAATCGVGTKPKCVTCAARDIHGITFDKDIGKDKLHAYFLWKIGMDIEAGITEYKPLARRGKGKQRKCKTKPIETTKQSLTKAVI